MIDAQATERVCNTCKHFKSGEKMTCSAFPKGIPMMFLSGSLEHTQVMPGQIGKTIWEALQK